METTLVVSAARLLTRTAQNLKRSGPRRPALAARQVMSLLLALLFGINPVAQGAQTPAQQTGSAGGLEEQVRKLTPGTFIEVRFTNKSKVRGYFSSVEADAFSFKEGSPASPTSRQAVFSDVKSVKVITKTHTPVGAWIAMAAILGAVVIAVVVVGIERHN